LAYFIQLKRAKIAKFAVHQQGKLLRFEINFKQMIFSFFRLMRLSLEFLENDKDYVYLDLLPPTPN
jgi:hypothetical protein